MRFWKFSISRLNKILLRKSFSLVEVLGALAISSVSIVTMTKLSIEMTQLAQKNQVADQATQVASRTVELLLKYKQKIPYPTLYSSCNVSNQFSYLQNTNGTVSLEKFSKTGEVDILDKYVPQLATTIGFVEVTEDVQSYSTKLYRSILLNYNQTYKIMNTRVIIGWTLYGKDYFYVNSSSFSLGNICK